MILKKYHILAMILSIWALNTGCLQEDSEHVTALLGEDVILRCTFEFPEGVPVPYVVQWQKQGVKIPIYIWYDGYPPHAGDGYEGRVSLTDQASLNLTGVHETDQGWYECKVYFLNRPPDSPKNGTWVHLDVHAPPHFRHKPPDVVYVKVSEPVSLLCDAGGTPPPVITWYKDNMPLEPSSARHVLPGELRITNLQQSDIGDYLCMARNREGTVTAVSKVIVAGPAVITNPPRNMSKLEGDKAEFICEAKALPSNVSHRWSRNKVEITQLTWLETRTMLRRDGTLVINPTSAEDSGLYTCEVSNGIGSPDSVTAYLSVEYPARVTYSPTIQYLPLGLSGILRCYVQASPPFQFVTWTKDRRPFDPTTTPGVSSLNNGSLLFQRVSSEHQGRYRCTPYNVHGTAGTSNIMEVLVREPPVFLVKPKEAYQKPVNSEVRMPCEGTGQPKPTILWRRADGEKLPRERSIIREGNLTIRGLRKEDHGRFECVLENEIATLVTSTLLLVEGTTPHAPTNVTVNTSSFDVAMSWLPAYDGNYEQTYVIWYRLAEQGVSDWRTVRVIPDGATTFSLFNLQPDTEYDFQVLSRNILGDGMFSPIIRARTKPWDYLGGVYPTDAYGATYIPTVQKPSGPKPWPPRNVTVHSDANGVQITWQPPLNQSVPVAFYFVEYRTEDSPWKRWGPIRLETSYSVKDLPAGQMYYFRVYAYSIMSVGSPSEEVTYQMPGEDNGQNRNKAITAGVVGGILFFIAAIVLSICAVKICNKRKRRKAEKAYMMVTCSVPDARNGGHTHAESPVPLKKCKEGRVPGVKLPKLQNLANRLAHLVTPAASDIGAQPPRMTFSRDWPYSRTLEPAPSPAGGRRFPKNLRYNVQLQYSRPLGWISRTAEGKFVLRDGREEEGGFVHVPSDAHFTPSNVPGARGSLRSDGSGQSTYHQDVLFPSPGRFQRPFPFPSLSRARQVTFSPASHALPTVYSPRDPRFRTSSPGPIAAGPFLFEDLSSVNHPSSAERSFPSTVSSHFASLSAQHTPSYELPSLRTLHDPYLRGSGSQFRPIPGTQPAMDVHLSGSRAWLLGDQVVCWPQHRVKPDMPVWGDGRHVHSASGPRPYLPHAVSWSRSYPRGVEVPSARRAAVYSPGEAVHRGTYNDSNSRPAGLDQQRPLATSSPPRPDRRIARVLPSSAKVPTSGHETFPRGVEQDGSDTTSSDHPMTYTRERLLGAVERVRSGALHRRQYGVPSELTAARVPTPVSPPVTPTAEDRLLPLPTTAPPPLRTIPSAGPDADTTYISDEALRGLDGRLTVAPPHSRASVTSGSSGRGSKEVSHSRGDSLQGELEAVNRSGSSSGFASRNVSNVQSSTSPGSGSSGGPPAAHFFAPVPLSSGAVGSGLDSPHSEPSFQSRGMADDSYEGASPPDSGLLDQLRRYSRRPASGDRGLSDSELYTDLYPKPKRQSKYDNTEARCAALKEEFLQFRRRQQERRRSEELESAC